MRLASSVAFVLLAAFALAACSSGDNYFRLEEYGEGWQLSVEETDKDQFRASWVEGSNRSVKLVNYQDDKGSKYTILNTLYLELDDKGTVRDGRLKRVVLPEFSRSSYYERNAQWFRVIEGSCTLNASYEGSVKLRCEGKYEFEGQVLPIEDLQVTRPVKK